MIKLGDKVKDSITGFEGVASGKCEYLNGCVSWEVRPTKLKDGEIVKSEWIDEQQLIPKSKAKVGGPANRPPVMSGP